ncbi:hypothetical protein PAPHI01_1157 [Pancytospora philotis]|nr:hypothetical protein PAPHI01_1157 [Pancytospora philotis]
MRVRARQFLKMLVLTGVFVSARLSTTEIASALQEEYGVGEYVDPEGPLNIMRGHTCVNNGMIAKQRKYAAPMRPGYDRIGYARIGPWVYRRNVYKDEVRKLPADSEAMVYLSEHYRILKSMFTVENDLVVVDSSFAAPFCRLLESEREKCLMLFAALLVLAGGGDIRLGINRDNGKPTVSLVVSDAGASAHVLDLGLTNNATLAVLKFFVKYGGNNASRVAGYGLHYTDSPSFLIQAYICEVIKNKATLVCILKAAKEIVARLPAGGPSAQLRPRFFTRDADYVRRYGRTAGYRGLAEAVLVFDGVQPALLEDWQKFDLDDEVDPKHIASALLKLCHCLGTNPFIAGWDDRLLQNPDNLSQRLFKDCVKIAFDASCSFKETGKFPTRLWRNFVSYYDYFVAVTRKSKGMTNAEWRSEDLSTVPATDPRDFLVTLAWVLGGSEEELQSLRQLLKEALSGTSKASSCWKITLRVNQMLFQFLSVTARAQFDVCVASDGSRFGVLWLALWPKYDDGEGNYVLKLAFKPEKVEVVYVSQGISLVEERQDNLVSVLRQLDSLCKPEPSSAHAAPEELQGPSVRSLIQESILRCVNPAAHRALAETHLAEAYATRDPLACHIAISRWMAYTPMQSLGDAIKAVDRQLPALEGLLARSTGTSVHAQRALTADSPVVAMLDNILGSAVVADGMLRPFIVDAMQHCVGKQTDLFPGIFSITIISPYQIHKLTYSAYDDLVICFGRYDIPGFLLRHTEMRARGMIKAASYVQDSWSSDICYAILRCFNFRYESSIRSLSGVTPDPCRYEYGPSAFINAASRAKAAQAEAIKAAVAHAAAVRAESAQAEGAQVGAARTAAAWAAGNVEILKKSNFCVDAARICTAAARYFPPGQESSSMSSSSDTLDICYSRYAVFAFITLATDPAMHHEYCHALGDICTSVYWNDTYSVIESYALLRKTFRKLPRPGPLSPELVAEVYPNGPTAVQIKSLLRIFAIFARTDRDYCGLCSVFNHYRRALSPVYAREFVKMLEDRDDAYRRALGAITFHKKIWSDAGHALPYSAFRDLLDDCLGSESISAHVLLERVQDLLGVKDLLRKESSCTIC